MMHSFCGFRRFVLSIIVLNVGFQACAVGPDYVPSQPELAPFHNQAQPLAVETQPVPAIEAWWTGFNDPTLATVLTRALSDNLDLAAALARVEQARAVAARAGADIFPGTDFDASSTFKHESLAGEFGSVATGSDNFRRNIREDVIGPSASWELDLFGRVRRSRAAAQEEVEATEADRASVRVIVAADIADAYFQIRGYQARIAVADTQLSIGEHLLTLVRERYDVGVATKRELAQAQALLEHARTTIPPLRSALEKQLNRQDVLMGAQPGTYARECEAVKDIPQVPPIPQDSKPIDVLRRRPDVIAAERRVAASSERTGAAISGYYPKISLAGVLGFDSLDGGNLFSQGAFEAQGGAALQWRLFDFGRIDAEVAKARGANAEALAHYRQTILLAAADVENALSAFAHTEARRISLLAEVQSLIKAHELSEEAYRAGAITLIDVLDADRQLLAASDDFAAVRADVARAAVGVFRAMGGGWEQ
jgi:NodT family efflux transporter outer membrane factor (OMF) lipoprotein